MTVPLASLRRVAMSVRLDDSFALAQRADSPSDGRVTFRRVEDAEAYLRYWAGESGAMVDLRRVLWRREPGAGPAAFSDRRILRALAQLVVSGTLVITESRIDVPRAAGESSVIAAATTAAPASIPISPITPPVVPAVPALVALADVQIEGAQVLPEVLQTMEQIDLTMTQVNLATASLEPTPSGVAAIGAGITDASGSITSTLTAL
ncbi:MAG TPA: hypothetical protein VGM67_01390 [Gemmatimonadaceae bacterium]|jgi:hypothetical protein